MPILIKIIEFILNTPVTQEPEFIAHVLIWLAIFSACYEIIYGLTLLSKGTSFVIGFVLAVFSARSGLNMTLLKVTAQFGLLMLVIWFVVWLLSSLGFKEVFEWIKEKKAEAKLEERKAKMEYAAIFGEELRKI